MAFPPRTTHQIKARLSLTGGVSGRFTPGKAGPYFGGPCCTQRDLCRLDAPFLRTASATQTLSRAWQWRGDDGTASSCDTDVFASEEALSSVG